MDVPALQDITDDEYERMFLAFDDGPLDPNDPYHVEMFDLATTLTNFRAALTPAQRRIVPLLHQHLPYTEIAEKARCSPQTVSNAAKNEDVRQCLRLLAQMDALYEGPSMRQRAYLAWQIALREQKTRPNTALRALDILNKQSGDYAAPDSTPQTPVINIREFKIVNQHPQEVRVEKDVTPEPFKPITVDVDDGS